MHTTVSVDCTSIFFRPKWPGLYNLFSQRIIGSFYISFCNMRTKSSLLKKEVAHNLSLSFSITFSFNPAPVGSRDTGEHTQPRVCRINKTSKWMFNEHFRSHNGMSLMSCNDLPAGGHASTLSLLLCASWQLSDNGLNFAECRTTRLHFHHPRTVCKYPRRASLL